MQLLQNDHVSRGYQLNDKYLDQALRGEEANCNDAPGAIPGMHSNGIQGVIKMQLQAHLRRKRQDFSPPPIGMHAVLTRLIADGLQGHC